MTTRTYECVTSAAGCPVPTIIVRDEPKYTAPGATLEYRPSGSPLGWHILSYHKTAKEAREAWIDRPCYADHCPAHYRILSSPNVAE